jgi:ribosome-binding factor A
MMTPKKKPSRKVLRRLCAEVHPDDGTDPRDESRGGRSRRKVRRKARQLGRQVAETLEAVLAGERDDVLRGLRVVSVAPVPGGPRLLVTVAARPSSEPVGPEVVLERLAIASGRLRCEVAAAITRRRAPVLVYRLALSPGG